MLENAWRAHMATGEPFELEQRARRLDGRYRWHWVQRVPMRDESGNVVKWYGVGLDIDDQKQAEDALRNRFGVGPEMSDLVGVVCLITIGDTEASIQRLVDGEKDCRFDRAQRTAATDRQRPDAGDRTH